MAYPEMDQAILYAEANLPKGWELCVTIKRGEAKCSVAFDPNLGSHDIPDSDEPLDVAIWTAVNWVRDLNESGEWRRA